MLRKNMFLPSLCLVILLNLFGIAGMDVTAAGAEAGSLRDVFRKVNPAVVVIVAQGMEHTFSAHDFSIPSGRLGSGVVISEDGLIMTCEHLVENMNNVLVFFSDGSHVRAKVINSAQQADVALLRLEKVPFGLQAAELGDSDETYIGDEVFVVGAPYGIAHTLTVGHISGRREMPVICQLTPIEFLQTDAGINVGNSGGPLFTMDGKVIGIVSRILSKSGGSEGLGFAVSINTAKALLFDHETLWSGIDTYLVTGDLARALNIPQEAGLLVQRIAKGSIAQKAGIRQGWIPVQIGNQEIVIGGDVLLEIQGIKVSPNINETCQIRKNTDKKEGKDIIGIKILRDGRILNLEVRGPGND